jgi:hypothetical protein
MHLRLFRRNQQLDCVRAGRAQFSGTFMFGDAATNAAIGRIAFGTGAVMDAGVTKGNYSARAILKAALPRDRSAFKRRFGLEFDF